MSISGVSPSSPTFVYSKVSSVSISRFSTLRSFPVLSRSLTVSANFLSRFRVKVGPGLSVRMRTSMMALYW